MRFSTFFTRVIVCMIAMCMVMTHVGDADAAKRKKRAGAKRPAASQPLGTQDPRYADIIMNPVTGEVYHADDPDGRRYPASLTKVMTLYLLFEAMEKGKVDLNDRMEVSALAARMPQTNLSLKEGDRIDVETAIEALVVRSANDVSVVVAEHLAGSVEEFAKKMTAKARALGMKSTTYKNPNGLPNTGQVTTARDQAKLGIAIKRDFPKYYRYFSTLQFSHNGVTYYTHNRVLLRYAGADGIKTGYINASGFNLITSVVRGGRPVVGVVLGGGSGRWRDDRMITLLDESYRTIAKRGGVKGRSYPGNLPLSRIGGKKAATSGVAEELTDGEVQGSLTTSGELSTPEPLAALADAQSPVDNSMDVEVMAIEVPADGQTDSSPFEAAERAALEVRDNRPSAAPEEKMPERTVIKPPAPKPPYVKPQKVELAPGSAAPQPKPPAPNEPAIKLSSRNQPFDLANPPSAMGDRIWGVQVGAFSTQDLASQAVSNALRIAPKPLTEARISMASAPASMATPVFRARLENLTQNEAKKACETLISQNSPCFIYSAAP